ncbi:MAG TPA: UDP-N-acetylglucosamine 2-epimerase (non-hydrolyzing) [Phycisphaerae bacterium]|nr:UDP-N-acetylglucosamine 2-epimerase (non-hydrolyzing) [Phycisphaerae bacterium]
MISVLTVLGTRPEAIKMAPVIKRLCADPARFRCLVCATGQHREMLDQVLDLFDIRPDVDLDLMRPDQTLSELTASLLTALDEVVRDMKPDWILAQGDTTTVAASALVAFYHDIPFGHVEAGLRTGDRRRPFPEEINRRIADLVADLYFAPTERARQALLNEGVRDADIRVTGNTVIDALLEIAARPYEWARGPLAALPGERDLVLITAHRRESFGEPFRELCRAIRSLANEFETDGVHFVYPVHLNPNVRRPVNEILSDLDNVSLIEPLDYLSLVHLMKHSKLILTDSGGIQEEAPSLGVPVLVMRDTTERPEGVEAGVVRLVGTSHDRIVSEARRLLQDSAAHRAMAIRRNPYGDGRAAERIVAAILERGTG